MSPTSYQTAPPRGGAGRFIKHVRHGSSTHPVLFGAMTRRRPTTALFGLLCAVALAAPASAATTFAPANAPGPALSVPAAKLAAALTCSKGGVGGATRAPVLLVQGTGATAKDNWSWTYEPALDKLHIPWCQIDLPDHATGDVQVNGEYVVYAIRTMRSRAGRRISIIGHSQGGMVPRWALRFWPDTRAMVDDIIGFAPSNHGTTQASATCGDGACSAADWQQWNVSKFVQALNSRAETWSGVSYTSIYTHTDEIVQPNLDDTGSSSLRTGAGRIENVATQDVCPNDTNEHLLLGLIDPVAYALAVDALGHDGPADPKRIAATVCADVPSGDQPGDLPRRQRRGRRRLRGLPGRRGQGRARPGLLHDRELPGQAGGRALHEADPLLCDRAGAARPARDPRRPPPGGPPARESPLRDREPQGLWDARRAAAR